LRVLRFSVLGEVSGEHTARQCAREPLIAVKAGGPAASSFLKAENSGLRWPSNLVRFTGPRIGGNAAFTASSTSRCQEMIDAGLGALRILRRRT
jgi:hypothetical protein